jgi:hypothetical protein
LTLEKACLFKIFNNFKERFVNQINVLAGLRAKYSKTASFPRLPDMRVLIKSIPQSTTEIFGGRGIFSRSVPEYSFPVPFLVV